MATLPADRPFRSTTPFVRGCADGLLVGALRLGHPLPAARGLAWVDRAPPACSGLARGFVPVILPCNGGVSRKRPVECAQDQLLYFSSEVRLECSFCHDGAVVLVPAGQFRSYSSQADADQQALSYGEAMLSCTPADPTSLRPDWEDLSGAVEIEQVDVYGMKGFDAAAYADQTTAGRMWCTFDPAVDFCDGPERESQPLDYEEDRYSVRWKAQNDSGVFSYAKVGEDWEPAPVALFPATVAGATGVSISFDANARPCFAFEVDGTVELRRFVADVPTTYSWPGSSPKLFFDGLLQPDIDLRDVACFYLSAGRVCARMQRDNFGVEYVLGELAGATELVKADRGTGADQNRLFLSALTRDGEKLLLRSGPYPFWPVSVRFREAFTLSAAPAGGAYWPVVLVLDTVRESLGVSATPAGGEYRSNRIPFPTVHESLGLAAAPAPTGNKYWPIRIDAGTYHEFVGLAAGPAATGNRYWLVRIDAGTYRDPLTISATPAGGTYAPV